MDLDEARELCVRTIAACSRPEAGMVASGKARVLVNVDGEGRAIISSTETAYKVRNLHRGLMGAIVRLPERSLDVAVRRGSRRGGLASRGS